jgi:hypothetical protein
MVDYNTSISWESVLKISCSWVNVLIFYTILFGVMRFHNVSDKLTALHFAQISDKVRFREEVMEPYTESPNSLRPKKEM